MKSYANATAVLVVVVVIVMVVLKGIGSRNFPSPSITRATI
jgi:hypothetical protein